VNAALLLMVPGGLLTATSLLVLATVLEERRVGLVVRMTLRGKADPDLAERVIAAELAPVLRARGLSRPAA
jgi:hypothetical protein